MNVSSVKNLNGETFSAVQDATLTDVVQTNSGNWQDITAYQSNSANYLTSIPSDLDLNNISANNVVFKDITETFQGEVSTAFTANLTDYGWGIGCGIDTTTIGYSSLDMKLSADLPITGTNYITIGVHQEYNEHFAVWKVPYDQIDLMNTLKINEYSAHFQYLANTLTSTDNITILDVFDEKTSTMPTGVGSFVISYPGIVTQPITFSSFYTNYGNTSAMLSGAIDYVSAHTGGGGGGGGDVEVNSFVYNNSATIVDVNTTYQSNSASYITELPDEEEVEFEEIDLSSFATSSQINELSGAIDYVSANAGGGYNETVLWSGSLTVGNTAQMTEPVSAFERYKLYLLGYERQLKVVNEFWTDGSSAGNEPYKVNPMIFQAGAGFFTINAGDCKWNTTWDNLQYVAGYNKWMPFNSSTWNQINTDTDSPTIVKIVGINRK